MTIQRGEVVQLGRHRLMCGDATTRADIKTLTNGKIADMVFTDPPYGVAVSGAGGRAIAGDLGNVAISGFFPLALEVLDAGGALYMCGGTVNVPLYFKLYEIHCYQLPKIIVWDKVSFILRATGYHSQHEFVYYGWKAGGGHRRHHWYGDRKQRDIWHIKRDASSRYKHPTQKPQALAERAILNSSPQDGIVYDPFAGSGSTLLACEQTGRRCFAMEIDLAYCQVIIDRYHALVGQEVVA